MKLVEKTWTSLMPWVRKYRMTIASAALVLLVLLAVPVVATSASPSFFGRYHDLSQNYDELQTSMHAGIGCRECHTDTRGTLVYSLALVGDFYTGLVREQRAPVFLEFDSPRREACLACHEDSWSYDIERTSRIPHPAHLRLASETRECVECHKWTAHEETYMEAHKEMPFSGICVAYGCHVGFRSEDQCTSCHHALRDETEDWLAEHPRIAQTIGTNACLESCHDADQCRVCHTTGERPVFDGLVTETGLRVIERLHVRADWIEKHGAQALEDQSKCMRCHVSDSECRACHAHRPASHEPVATWISRHKDLADDGRRCLTCHEKSWCEACHEQFKEMR
ncbi:MAG: NapC/NirT family cytochrome c [Coriobacteriia bacterium]|nr:NapC/NirT family cytochrome c [Coriobacteriia bacterium]